MLVCLFLLWGHAVDHLVETLCYKPEGRGLDCRLCRWNISLIISGRTMGQISTQTLKAVVHRALQTYHFHMLIVLASGSLNLVEPSGSIQACTRIALLLPLPIFSLF